ncbi:MAG: DUF1800 domain-containing protein [Bacteroidia bacterium]|nr:DUF1800 domain-containing protein [Bacteroidia bacterium]
MMERDLFHLYNRAAFGRSLLAVESGSGINEHFHQLLKESEKVNPLSLDLPDGNHEAMDGRKQENRAGVFRSRQESMKMLNAVWLSRLCSGEQELRERMTLFWANHFSCRTGNPVFALHLNNLIREHALGNFGDLLRGVSRSPAMLQFLNNQQNRKAHPNENFARELLELFTMGRGNYTEKDVAETARAFTGWSFNREGVFAFRAGQHDDGWKEVLGKKGRLSGEDVLAHVLEQKQTAVYLVRKFWKHFVSLQADEDKIRLLADDFYKKGYDIRELLKSVFLSDWFYAAKYKGALIKSPVELMIPLIRDFKVSFANHNVAIGFQKLLGQVLFNPPNVAGWPPGRAWIDHSTLSLRLRLSRVLLDNNLPDLVIKDSGDANDSFRESQTEGRFKSKADWNAFYRRYDAWTTDDLFTHLASFMLAVGPGAELLKRGKEYLSGVDEKSRRKEAVLYVSTLPEYQVC